MYSLAPEQIPQALGQRAAESRGVRAELGYLRPGPEPHYTFMYQPPEGVAWSNCDYQMQRMEIADARALPPASIHREGHELWDAPSAVKDFHDADTVIRRYYPEMAELARTVAGGRRALVFDHQLRKREAGRPPLGFGRHGDGRNPAAVGRVHNDYSEESGRRRLALVLRDAAQRDRVGRFSIINIWRSIAGPVRDTPLAVCDARSVAAADWVPAEIRYQERSGEIYLLRHNPAHRWAYYPEMDRHEALVFKQYDSQDAGPARFTPHAAFDLPAIPPDAPLRESIELRCLVIHD